MNAADATTTTINVRLRDAGGNMSDSIGEAWAETKSPESRISQRWGPGSAGEFLLNEAATMQFPVTDVDSYVLTLKSLSS